MKKILKKIHFSLCKRSPFDTLQGSERRKVPFRACPGISGGFRGLTIIAFLTASFINSPAQNINHQSMAGPMGLNVNSFNGNLFFQRTDLFIYGRKLPFNLTFYYNSMNHTVNMGYGKGWSMEYTMKYIGTLEGVKITRGDGFEMEFEEVAANNFKAPNGVFDSLVKYQPGKFMLITKEKTKFFFDDSVHRSLTRIEEINGNFLNFTYTDSMMTQITDAASRSIQLTYQNGKLSQITDALGTPVRTIKYTYDNNGNLTEVEDPLGNKFKYAYLLNGPLNLFTDKNGNAADIVYNAAYLVKEIITCITNQRFSYDKNLGITIMTELVSGQNQITTYRYNSKGEITQKEGNCCGFNTKFEYDNAGNVTKFTDANGNASIFTYDNHGNMLNQKDPLNNSEHYTYHPVFNKITSYIDKNGNTTAFSYDSKGNPTLISFPLGITNSFTYASSGDRSSFTNGRGFTTNYSYNNYGNMISENKPLGATTTFSYDTRSRLLTISDPLNQTTSYVYDALDRTTSVIDALNNTTAFTYDANDNLITKTDALNHATTYSYDALDRNVMITNALGHNKVFSYDSKNNLISSTDENGNKTISTYDNLNRLISKTNAENETTSYNRDAKGNLTSIINPNGNEETFTYDALNRMINKSDSKGVVFSLMYDNSKKTLTKTDGNGNAINYSYDAFNRMILVIDAMGKSTIYSFDGNSNTLIFTDRNNHSTNYAYDALDRKISESDPLNNTTTYSYDLAGNLTGITDANSNTTTFTYDALNRKTGELYASGIPKTFTYDAVGNIATKTDGNGTATYSYDAMNRLTLRNYPGSNDDTFTYDNAGRRLTANNNDATISFTYDGVNRMTNETLNGKATGYFYDTPGRKRTLSYPGGRIINEQFDERNRLISISEGNSSIATFAYDGADRNISLNYSNGTSTNVTYDANNRIISILSNPVAFQYFEYAYDFEGNALFEKENHHPTFSEQYQYDNAHRLIHFKAGTLSGSVISNPTTQTQYNYDGLGNRNNINVDGIITNYTTNTLNQYTSIIGTSTINPTYDSNGNLTYDGTYIFSYDNKNKLINVNSGTIATYKYDALGRQIQKALSSETTNYYYSGQNLIEERDISNILQASFVSARGLDNIITIQRYNNNYFYHKNALGSITTITNNTGALVERYEYDAFGKPSIYNNSDSLLLSSAIGNTFMFTAREFNKETYYYHYRARTYNFEIGRFLQRDPIGFYSGLNLYTYVNNNSINFIDPLGLMGKKPDKVDEEEEQEKEDDYEDYEPGDEKKRDCTKVPPNERKNCENYNNGRMECFQYCKSIYEAQGIWKNICDWVGSALGCGCKIMGGYDQTKELQYRNCKENCQIKFPNWNNAE